jgi:glyoxylase-like metal-dependent hydrolase (beta-lactamase superfamily II)
MKHLMNYFGRRVRVLFTFGLFTPIALLAADAASKGKPVLLYSRYYNAEGENRYLPDGAYKEVMQRLREDFEVRVHNQPLTRETLAGVSLLLIANPSVTPGDQSLLVKLPKTGSILLSGDLIHFRCRNSHQ